MRKYSMMLTVEIILILGSIACMVVAYAFAVGAHLGAGALFVAVFTWLAGFLIGYLMLYSHTKEMERVLARLKEEMVKPEGDVMEFWDTELIQLFVNRSLPKFVHMRGVEGGGK